MISNLVLILFFINIFFAKLKLSFLLKKEEARKKFLRLRNQLSKDQMDKSNLDLFQNVKKLPIWDKTFYHIFLPIQEKKEINTYPIVEYLWALNKKVCIPKIDPSKKNTMDCILFEEETLLEINSYGIYEPLQGQKIDPKSLEVIFVPLLAFDLSGHRIGYGMGFYDRFFETCKKKLLKIGLSFFGPIEKIQNPYKKDILLDKCITPMKNYKF